MEGDVYKRQKHDNIAGAGIPAIKDIPDEIEVIHLETERDKNPFGSSGASEAYQSSGHVAVINAIYNACLLYTSRCV